MPIASIKTVFYVHSHISAWALDFFMWPFKNLVAQVGGLKTWDVVNITQLTFTHSYCLKSLPFRRPFDS